MNKKVLLVISAVVLIACAVSSCSVNKADADDISTTCVTDAKGQTHYYEPALDNKENTSVYYEIETHSNGKAVTRKDGGYVTKTDAVNLSNKADNVVEFEPSKDSSSDKNATDKKSTSEKEISGKITSENTTETSEKNTAVSDETEKAPTTENSPTTKVVTDKDGWINKWY